jgi:hypothetical protein
VSVFGPRDGEMMTLDRFRAILDKLQSEAKVRVAHLYMKGEPTLNKDLPLLVAELTRRKIKSSVSTVLQTVKCDLSELIEAKPSEFRISYPGLNFIEKYQKGSPRKFMENLRKVVTLPRYPETKWVLFHQLYKDTGGQELENSRNLAKLFNLKLEVVPSIHMVSEHIIDKQYTEAERELISNLLETPEESIARMDTRSRYCLQWKHVTLDAMGDAYVCTLMYEEQFKIGNFLDIPLKELQRIIRSHPICGPCMEVGNNIYQACYSEFIENDNPVATANKKRLK